MDLHERFDAFLASLTLDERKALAHHALTGLYGEGPEVTIRDFDGDWGFYCPTCDDRTTIMDVDMSVRHNRVFPEAKDAADVSLADNENETLYYLCEPGNHLVSIDPTIDIAYG